MTNIFAVDPRVRARRGLIAVVAALTLVAGAAPAVAALGRSVSVIVTSSDTGTAGALVYEEHGQVISPLPIINGVVARVPESRLADLSTRAFVVADRAIHLTGKKYDSGSGALSSSSLISAATSEVGAPSLWQTGLTGAGQTVALIDTGVADVPDLADHVIAEANLTSEDTAADTFGHGTFQAGLIAGDGTASDGAYMGVAPNANIVSVKVAGADGSTTLGKVLVGAQIIDRAAKKFNIRVALLALSSDSPLPPELDPLSRALRALWADGIVVVVPAGNTGPGAGTIGSPGEDPVLLTAGSVNDLGTSTPLDDIMSDFSSRGPTRWGADKPDVVAPGEHLVSLRAPGSTVDQANPSARVGDSYFKGSGTSMSAAVTAGAAALVVDAHPNWSPDQVKAALMATANPMPDADFAAQGAGIIDTTQAIFADAGSLNLPDAPNPNDALGFKAHSGDGSNADDNSDTANNSDDWKSGKKGRQSWNARQWDARSWDSRQWAARQWDARSWDARTWDGRTWDARQWEARQWAARTWAARQWAARQWASRSWDARSWDARSWDSRSWDGRSWDARSWDGRSWDSRSWDARSWESRQWDSRSWDSRQWDSRSWDSRTWDSRQWDSRQWDSRQWDSRTWEGIFWSSRQWDSRQWDSRQWDSRQWDSRQWSSRQWDSRQWDAASWA